MATYYHVAHESYETGSDLLSYVELWNQNGERPEYKWSEMNRDFYEDSEDARVVCMFESLEEAQQFQDNFGGKLLRIELPEWADEEGLRVWTVEEGFPCIDNRIPFELCGEQVIFEQ